MHCKTESIIERAIRNAKIAAKENIESGIPLSTQRDKLHQIVINLLTENIVPLDVFEKGEVVHEEHYCIPAYIFTCNGTESFNYEVGNDRTQVYTKDLGDRVETWEKTVTEWVPSNGTASTRETIFAPGNKNMTKQFKQFYSKLNTKSLIDIEDLAFPADVETCKTDIPLSTAFDEYAVPVVESILKNKAKNQISKQTTTGLTFGGANITKEVTRIFPGIYRVVFKYQDKEYSIWISGDGSKWYCDERLPSDTAFSKAAKNRESEIEEKTRAMNRQLDAIPKPKTGVLTFFVIICTIGALFTYGVSLIGTIIFSVFKSKANKSYTEKYYATERPLKREIDDFRSNTEMISPAQNVSSLFKSGKHSLRGIYANLSKTSTPFLASDHSSIKYTDYSSAKSTSDNATSVQTWACKRCGDSNLSSTRSCKSCGVYK